MIFFAIFIVNSFLNSGLGYVGTSGGVGLSGNISGAINFDLNCSFWSGLRSLLLRSISLLCLSKWDRCWVREWLWISEISSVCFNLDLSSCVGCYVSRFYSDSKGGFISCFKGCIRFFLRRVLFGRFTLVGLLKRNWV